jgi:hypothetical protein
MSTPHKATPDQWEKVKYLARLPNSHWAIVSCLLELRARIEALEADGPAVPSREPASVAMQPTPASSLVERVARAAIREVAAWLRTGRLLHAAELLELEADRG